MENMLHLSESAMTMIRERADQAITELEQGKSTKEILSGLYVAGMPDKTDHQGELMAERIVEVVAGFTVECNEAIENLDAWANAKLDSLLEGKTLQERCVFLMRFAGAMNALNAASISEHMNDSGISAEEIAARVSAPEIDPAAANEALESELRAQAIDAMRESGLMFSRLEEMADILEEHREEDVAEYVIDFGIRSADYKAVASMIAYISAKNGSLPEIPPSAGIDEITVGVCAAIETQHVAAQVVQGKLGEDIARLILEIIGIVAVIWLAANLIIAGALLTIAVIPGILGIFAGITLGVLVIRHFWRSIGRLATKSGEILSGAGMAVVTVVAGVLRGIARWARERAFPAIAGIIRRGVDFLSGLIARGAAIVREERREEIPVQG